MYICQWLKITRHTYNTILLHFFSQFESSFYSQKLHWHSTVQLKYRFPSFFSGENSVLENIKQIMPQKCSESNEWHNRIIYDFRTTQSNTLHNNRFTGSLNSYFHCWSWPQPLCFSQHIPDWLQDPQFVRHSFVISGNELLPGCDRGPLATDTVINGTVIKTMHKITKIISSLLLIHVMTFEFSRTNINIYQLTETCVQLFLPVKGLILRQCGKTVQYICNKYCSLYGFNNAVIGDIPLTSHRWQLLMTVCELLGWAGQGGKGVTGAKEGGSSASMLLCQPFAYLIFTPPHSRGWIQPPYLQLCLSSLPDSIPGADGVYSPLYTSPPWWPPVIPDNSHTG